MSFTWASMFTVATATSASKGDKIVLPPNALESIIQAHGAVRPPQRRYPNTSYNAAPQGYDQQDNNEPIPHTELPSPLTFQILNPLNRLITHGGVQEFSAADGQVHLPAWMMATLSLAVGDEVLVKFAPLSKGTWARFRPTTADYTDIIDFRALLEAELRSRYTTLTRGEVLKVHQGLREYGFVVEELKPEPGEAVCITDTDLEVDIVPLEASSPFGEASSVLAEGQPARNGSLRRSLLRIGVESSGSVNIGEYQYWSIDIPNKDADIQVRVDVQEPGDLDLLVSTRMPVSLQDHNWANFEAIGARIITISASDPDYTTLQDDTIHIAVYGRAAPGTEPSLSNSSDHVPYSICVRYDSKETPLHQPSMPTDATPKTNNQGVPGYQECSNCGSWIPAQSLILHSNFCLCNNIKCKQCGEVIQKNDFPNHFHCEHCDKHGHISEKGKHMEIYHGWYQCSCQHFESPALPELSLHRRTVCPEHFIICRYCHTLVQQGGPSSNARDHIRGLLMHESYCGDRTIQCQKCSQMVSLKDVQVHAQNHEYERQNQVTPQLCSNKNCVRTKSGNVLGLCQLCFGPFWITTEDPRNQKLLQRLARKYHSQLTAGCRNKWCRNEYCATFRGQDQDATAAAAEMMSILKEAKVGLLDGGNLWLCVDESTTRKKVMAEILFHNIQGYALEWCIKAIENEKTDLEAAMQWLKQNAPKK